MAAKNDSAAAVKALLDLRVNVNLRILGEDTPLHVAVRCNSESAVKVLLDAGAKVNLKGKLDFTPLRLCNYNEGRTPIVEALLKAGAIVDESTSWVLK